VQILCEPTFRRNVSSPSAVQKNPRARNQLEQVATRHHIPEDGMLQSHRCENLKSYTHFSCLCLFKTLRCSDRSRDSDSLQARRQRCRCSSPGGVKNFLFSTSSRLALGTKQPHIQCVLEALSPMVKRLEREAVRSPPTSAEVKKTWIYTSTLPCVFMA
jgi:hypothetical protein